MRINVDVLKFKKGLEIINEVAKIKGVMYAVKLEIKDNLMLLKYNNGEQSAIHEIEIENIENDNNNEKVVNLDIITILEKCQGIDYIVADPLDIEIKDNVMKIISVKRYSEEHELSNQEVSNMEYSVSIYDKGAIQFAILDRCNYDEFVTEQEEYDVWNKLKLIEILKIALFEKTNLYFSKSLSKAYTRTNAFFYAREIDNISEGFVLDSNSASGMINVCKLIPQEEFEIKHNKDQKTLIVNSKENGTTIRLLTLPAIKTDVQMAELYIQKINFESCKMIVNKLVLSNSIDTLIMLDKAEKHIIYLNEDNNGKYIGFKADRGSSKNEIKTYIQRIDKTELVDKKFKGSVLIQYLKSNIDSFKGQWVKISIEKMSELGTNQFCLRLEDILNDEVVSTVYTSCIEE